MTDWQPKGKATHTTTKQPADEQVRETYTRAVFLRDLENVSRVITNEIDRDPKEAAKLRKSLKQAREGKTSAWRNADDDT